MAFRPFERHGFVAVAAVLQNPFRQRSICFDRHPRLRTVKNCFSESEMIQVESGVGLDSPCV